MKITKKIENTMLNIALEGRLDTITAPEFEQELNDSLNGITDFVLDLEKLDYISSAGLRVILKAQKIMNTQGRMKLTHVRDTIMEVFDITGFANILTIE